MRGKQARIGVLCISGIKEQDCTCVCFAADHTAGSLQYFVHAGISVSKSETVAKRLLIVFPKRFLTFVDLWEADADNDSPDQLCARKVDAFGKHTAEYAQGHERAAFLLHP